MGRPSSTKEEFVERARQVHGSKYSYTHVDFKNMRTKVAITCRKHGDFTQAPFSHLSGRGCPVCGRETSRETMLQRYGYEYSMQSPEVLKRLKEARVELYGSPRPDNAGRKPLGRDEFERRARLVHGDRYDYSLVDYVDTVTPVKIICPEHGVFEQAPGSHLAGGGCPDPVCAALRRRDKARARLIVDQLVEQFHEIENAFRGCYYIRGQDLRICVTEGAAQRLRDMTQDAVLQDFGCVILTDPEGRDAELWFRMGCPVGHDLVCRYSWLPRRDLTEPGALIGSVLSNAQMISQVAKSYQNGIVYRRERALWDANQESHGMSLQAFLYWNRLRYLDKTPDMLSNAEILRAFTIAGVLRGYTVFDTTLMSQVLAKYDIKSVYDPCAGWGERMLCCFKNGIEYTGVDINEDLIPGYEQMMQDYRMEQQEFLYGDSSLLVPGRQYDCILTCPPYGSTEIYSPRGAENLDCDVFAKWWSRVVMNCLQARPQYFCVQTNQKYRDVFSGPILDAGFVLIESLEYPWVRASHLNRGSDGSVTKRERETMLVFAAPGNRAGNDSNGSGGEV